MAQGKQKRSESEKKNKTTCQRAHSEVQVNRAETWRSVNDRRRTERPEKLVYPAAADLPGNFARKGATLGVSQNPLVVQQKPSQHCHSMCCNQTSQNGGGGERGDTEKPGQLLCLHRARHDKAGESGYSRGPYHGGRTAQWLSGENTHLDELMMMRSPCLPISKDP